MDKQELVVLVSTVGLVGFGIGHAVGKYVQRKTNKKVEDGFIILIQQTKEILEIAKKVTTENQILKAKVKEFGGL